MVLKDSYPFLALSFTGIVFSLLFDYLPFLILSLILAIFVLYFFRDPERSIPEGNNVVSPADGKVIKVMELNNNYYKKYVAIFMTVFNVHINRAPIEGEIIEYEYKSGRFKPAFDDTASIENEHNFITIQNKEIKVKFSQIAGIIARRIVFWKKKGDIVKKGEKIGLIKFGSRVDIYLPDSVELKVKKGEWVKGGETIIGVIKSE